MTINHGGSMTEVVGVQVIAPDRSEDVYSRAVAFTIDSSNNLIVSGPDKYVLAVHAHGCWASAELLYAAELEGPVDTRRDVPGPTPGPAPIPDDVMLINDGTRPDGGHGALWVRSAADQPWRWVLSDGSLSLNMEYSTHELFDTYTTLHSISGYATYRR